MFSFFKRKSEGSDLKKAPQDFSFLGTDMHSHLVPGIDDGAPDPETSLALIRGLKALGYSKLITTPHSHLEFYDNTADKIRTCFEKLKQFIDDQRIGIELGIASEYYLDSLFPGALLPSGLLTFGDNYVLIEVSMAGWPRTFGDMVFAIQSLGYKPILAHPERYLFEENIKVYNDLKSRGMLFQMNLLSLTGYYGRGVKKLAELYLHEELYSFCGSDTHHQRHVDNLGKMAKDQPELMLKLSEYPNWLNHTL